MNWIDADGLPGAQGETGEFDGGDTAAILGTLWAFGLYEEYSLPWNPVVQAPLRHPDQSRWYGQPDRFSRDQLVAVLCGLCRQSWRNSTKQKLFTAHLKLGLVLAWNTRKNGQINAPAKAADICGPEVWALWIRCFKAYWLWPLLCILDIENLIGTLDWRFRRKDRVTRNHMLGTITAYNIMPTPISALSYWLTNWADLTQRWRDHSITVNEYPTYKLFEAELGIKRD